MKRIWLGSSFSRAMAQTMARTTAAAIMALSLTMAFSLFAAAAGPEIQYVDGKVSIQAEGMKLSQFLQLWDQATGMTSTVNPSLANEKISVRLDDLDVDAAIRKSFQGQPWNYIVMQGKGIKIIDRASTVALPTGGTTSIQPIADTRNDNPPPPVPFSQPAPPPVAAAQPAANPNGNGTSAAAQPAGAINLPPVQGGTAAPAPLFQTPGATLGAPLPGAQPAR
jgi:hypothetical protein